MGKYTVLRCPWCKYVWVRRAECMPISCPRCKKRFDYGDNRTALEKAEHLANAYSAMREWLVSANRHSLQCDSLEEVEERIAQS